MSKIALTPNASGTAVFTISSPATNTNRTLTLPDEAGSIVVNTATGIDVTGVITTDGMTTSADINFGDNDKAIFGAGSDLEIYHDGTNNRLTLASANTYIQTDGIVHFTDIGNNEKHLTINDDGAVDLYHNNALKLATTATGIDVTGAAAFTGGISIDGQNASTPGLSEKTDLDTGIFWPAANTIAVSTAGTERMRIDSSGGLITNPAAGGHAVFNENSVDADFRVESEGNANMLFVDGGENAVGIGTIPPAWRAGLADVGFNVGVNAALYDQTGGGVFLVNNWYRADDNTLTYRNTNEAQYMQMEGGEFSFANAASGSAGAAITFTERMKIDASGGLILVGSTAQKATGTTWSNPSDQRLKTDIRDYTKGSAELMQVRVREWLYNGKGGTVDGMAGLGVIADEVMTVLPDTVETYEAFLEKTDELPTAIKKFDATEITWLLVTSLQEALTEISALKVRVAALETV
jgi:hypothetical protein